MKKIVIALLLMIVLVAGSVLVLSPKMHKRVKIDENYKQTVAQNDAVMQVEWNDWHSRVVNKLILEADTAPVNQPLGTINYIEFEVDSLQNIVNIKIYSDPEKYSNTSKKHFAPVVRALDGDSVLKFPNNTERKLVKFKAVLKKDKKTKLSSPEDFEDIEMVTLKR